MTNSTVLIVDDNDAGRYAICRALQLAGFPTKEAATGNEALLCISESTPEIVLLDVSLPDINGIEICRRIKNDPQTRSIPVLMMSATHIRNKDRVKGLEGGADAYLTGPLEPEVLIATMNALLRAKIAEEALQNSALQWQTTFDAISDGVALVDRDGKIKQCNISMEKLFGRRSEEIIGTLCSTLLGIENDDAPCMQTLARRERFARDIPFGDRWLHMASDPVVNEQGEIDGTVCIISDITERKQSEVELQKAKDAAVAADRAKDQFLAVLSHELRTPLTPVMTAIYAMQDDKLPAEVSSYLDVIKRNVELEARLIDDLLDLTRIGRGKIPLNIETVDAHALMGNVIAICQTESREKRIAVDLDLRAARHHVEADPARLQQVFWNLIKNAVKFTPTGGRITIASRNSDPDHLIIEIADNGIGIDSQILPRIFNAFEQGEQIITRQFGGLGLGLAISKALVDMHEGKLSAASPGKDRGATFTIELPAVDPVSAQRTWPEEIMQNDAKGEMQRILIVDDHVDTSRVMQLLLERRGYYVETAQTMQTALEVATTGTYDLLISDIGLPDGSGLELMRELRRLKEIPGIALSGFGMEEDIQNSIEAGFSEHLTKPVSFKRLEEVIQRLLSA